MGLETLSATGYALLHTVIDATERIERGDFSVRVTESGPNTLRSLARTFNSMAERLQRNEKKQRLPSRLMRPLSRPKK